MPKYRKLPVEIEAIQFDGTKKSANEILAWIGSWGADARRAHTAKPERGLIISMLEGDMRADLGDFVIREPFPTGNRQFYPCKPDIFAATYEEIK